MSATWSSYGPTKQHTEQFGYALEGLDAVTKRIKTLQQETVPALQMAIVNAGGPWSVGSALIAN
jgi:diacylglycerol kinase